VAYRVRVATIDDAPAIGRVHVRAWQAAYRGGLMPDSYLDALSVEHRTALWGQRLAAARAARSTCLVAEDEERVVTGFIDVGAIANQGEAEGPGAGEIRALNVDPDHWGTGAGCDLLAWGVETLDRCGFSRAVLWVHPDNARARRFYRVHGWTDDGIERRVEVLGVMVPETRCSRSLVSGS
jgi:ribosomal protein S18 acetylase RimI-like enzyme